MCQALFGCWGTHWSTVSSKVSTLEKNKAEKGNTDAMGVGVIILNKMAREGLTEVRIMTWRIWRWGIKPHKYLRPEHSRLREYQVQSSWGRKKLCISGDQLGDQSGWGSLIGTDRDKESKSRSGKAQETIIRALPYNWSERRSNQRVLNRS